MPQAENADTHPHADSENNEAQRLLRSDALDSLPTIDAPDLGHRLTPPLIVHC